MPSSLKGGRIVDQYIEVETWKNYYWPLVMDAIEYARKIKVTLVITNLDRLSYNAAFIFTLKDSGMDFAFSDMTEVKILTIDIFSMLAKH